MPTYQYACTACGHTFEQVQSFHEDALTHCPECDGRLRKVFNAVGVVFKGSGFYRTDSRSGSTSSVPAGGSSESSSGSGSSGSGSSGSGSSGSGSGSGSSGTSGTGSSGGSSSGSSSTTGS
ncbi:FmdB family zinc ribbon protein [Nocardioides sp.]|uniref:FmdB family zinc ribbon protein n=1 Tax=Nocardioides sp. TaxID=35761 RepID=UPI003529AFE5